MTNLVPAPAWDDVRQLEANEYATGGAGGNMNEQALALTARTGYLDKYTASPYRTGKVYNLNERVQLENGDIVKSTIANNTANPNVDMTGWLFYRESTVTPRMFGAKGDGISDDRVSLIRADAYAAKHGLILDGQGLEYAISSKTILTCANFKNIKIVPVAGYAGDGVDLVISQTENSIWLNTVKVNNFKGYGGMILKGTIPSNVKSLFAAQDCDFSNNGSVTRSTLAVPAAGNAKTQTVVDASVFSAEQSVWISDCRVKIASVSGNVLTMVSSNGITADILEGSSTNNPVGQYVTLNNAGRNGLQIGGNHEDEFDIFLSRVKANDCGWFGIYNRITIDPTNKTIFYARGCEAHRCGFIGMGAGRTYIADIQGCFADENGNNGIDSNATFAPSFFKDNICLRNGADGLFVCPLSGYINPVIVAGNTLRDNLRIGCLFSGGNDDNIITNNTMTGNLQRNFGSRGVHSGKVTGNNFGGDTEYHVYIEGRDNYPNPDGWDIHHNTFKSVAKTQDISGNFGGYVSGGLNGGIKIQHNEFASTIPKIEIFNVDTARSKCFPSAYFTMMGNKTEGEINAVLSISIQVKNPLRTAQNLNISKKVVLSAYSSYPSNPVRALAATWSNRTSGLLVHDSITTNGYAELVTGFSGLVSVDLAYNAAAKRYYVAELDNVKQVIEMEWLSS